MHTHLIFKATAEIQASETRVFWLTNDLYQKCNELQISQKEPAMYGLNFELNGTICEMHFVLSNF